MANYMIPKEVSIIGISLMPFRIGLYKPSLTTEGKAMVEARYKGGSSEGFGLFEVRVGGNDDVVINGQDNIGGS